MTDRADRDLALIEKYLTGDHDAFNDLVTAHEERVFAICLRMLHNREAALDATQDTFLTVLSKADSFIGKSAFSTWLYRVTVNTCYDHLRREKRSTSRQIPESYDPSDPRSVDLFDAVEVRQEIEDALSRLSSEFRAAVVLVDLQGISIDQASKILDTPVGTIKSRLFRARRQLALLLGNLRDPSNPLIGDDGE